MAHCPPPCESPCDVARLRTWAAALAGLVEARRAQAFAWGANDCASFAAEAYRVQTGRDALHELRGERRTARQAARQACAIGGIPAALQRAGLQRCPPALAQRGDLVQLAQGRQRVLAVCMGAEAVAPGLDGIKTAPMAQAVMAWRV